VAILSRVSAVDPVASYRHGTLLIIGFFLAAGVVSAVLLTGRPVVASDPEPAGSGVPAADEGFVASKGMS
jgi:hypothetical protein